MSVKKSLKKWDQAEKMAQALNRALAEVRTPERMMKYGKMAADMIKLRTKLGSGVAAAGQEKRKLKPLADSTVEQRERLAKKGKLSDMTTPRKSNLTRTGQLLDSMRAHDPDSGTVLVGPSGNRKNEKRGLTNELLGAFVTAAGRAFNNLSKIEIKRMNDTLKREIRAVIRKQLTKNK